MTFTNCASLKKQRHANIRKNQLGLSMIGILLILSIGVFFATAAFKVGPSYAEFWTISKIAEDAAADSELMSGTKRKVYEKLQAGFTQNNLWDAVAKERISLVKDRKGGMMVNVDYESRTNLFANIHVVTTFQKQISNSAQ